MTAHELAADWTWMEEFTGFRVAGGRVVWEEAEYVGDRLRIGRVVIDRGVRAITRYINPDTRVTLVK